MERFANSLFFTPARQEKKSLPDRHNHKLNSEANGEKSLPAEPFGAQPLKLLQERHWLHSGWSQPMTTLKYALKRMKNTGNCR